MNDQEPTVFVVDDDPGVADAIRLLLRSVGLTSEAFGSAKDFLESYDSGRAGCLVLDVRMPGMSGLELLEKIRTTYEKPPPVVMMITAYGDDHNRTTAEKLGANDFLTKPLDFSKLKEKLNALS